MRLTKTDVKLKVDRKPVTFSLYHNLQKRFGLSFDDALDNWLNRTDEYTAESLRDYIKDKIPGCICLTESEFQNV